jgi:outer membrane protein assembly factor BamB
MRIRSRPGGPGKDSNPPSGEIDMKHLRNTCLALAGLALATLVPALCGAGDWPMWRFDAGRRGGSELELPEKLHLEWLIELPAPRPAWPASQEKLQFDRLYEPVLAGKRLFVGSMVSDRLTAYDTESGEERWRFYAEGPVRFAPVAAGGKVYFTSDDGYLYCLSAEDGSLLWKFRGGPSDRKVLGQDRLVSSWPARGAPVLYDGTIYFGASIWPFLGTFIHALEAESGAVVWTQSGNGSSYLMQQHSSPAFAGVAPQGYIAATAEHLLVAGGRTVPGVFERRTGKFLHFNVASRDLDTRGGGGYEVYAGKDFYITRGMMYRLDTGAFVAAADATLLTDHAMIGADREGIRGFRPGWREEETKDRRGTTTKKLVVKPSWSTPLDERVKRVFIRSGSRVYASGEKGTVLAIDLPRYDRGAQVSWSVKLPDEPLNIISGDSRLFVTTHRGRIYCFGGTDRGLAVPEVQGMRPVELVARGATWSYLDDGSNQGQAWRASDFDDAAWLSGPGKLGYGDDNEVTKLSFGPDPKKKPVTCYFRHVFEVPPQNDYSDLLLKVLVDDGAVIYLNGEEAARLFMPAGEIHFDTLASSGTDENKYHEVAIPSDLLKPGRNVLAAEVHQVSRESSDLSFDLELTAIETAPPPLSGIAGAGDAWAARAGAILRASGAAEGYCVALGIASGRLIEEIAAQSRLHVIAIDPDAARVDAYRRRLDGLGVYGTRIAVLTGEPLRIELPPYLAELVISEEPAAAGFGQGVEFVERVFHVLRPYKGVACFASSSSDFEAFARAAAAARLDNGEVRRFGSFALLRRYDAPAGSGEWTHQYADAGNTVASKDRLVKLPLGLLWWGGPSNEEILPRHGHGPTPQVAGGRLFIEGRHLLRAMDIYTGRLLWERRLRDLGKFYDYLSHEPGANAIGSNYVSLADGVYVVHGKSCLRLDPATGQTVAEFRLPLESGETEPPDWGYIGAWKSYLIAGARPNEYTSPAFNRRDVLNLKDDPLKQALLIITTWTGFAEIPREKDQDDHDYLVENVNKLLLAADMMAKIPQAIRSKAKAEEAEKKLEEYLKGSGRSPLDHEALVLKRQLLHLYYGLPKYENRPAGKFGSQARVGSSRIVALDRFAGKALWDFDGHHQIRHNAVAIGGGMVFLIDRLPQSLVSFNRRRGLTPAAEEARLVALDIRSGDPIWSASQRVFGTWLGYSEEHDVLLQAGSQATDRALDEADRGMVAYRGTTGEVLWENDEKYSGPCMLVGEMLITQGYGSPGFALELSTGKRIKQRHPVSGAEIDLQYTRNYGCNTAVACPNLLTFRSAAAGYFDLSGRSGTGNFGGFRSGCTSNLIPAGGVLSAPDYTRTCTCAYQNQTSLALVHQPEVEMWTFQRLGADGAPALQVGLNFGAPGDRRGPDGTLWLDQPSTGGPSPDIPVESFLQEARYLRYHTSRVEGELPWVAASALEGEGEIEIELVPPRRIRIDNDIAGGPPLEASNARLSATRIFATVPQTGARNRTSVRKGSRPGEANLAVRQFAALATESVTVEFWTRTDGDIVFADAGAGDKSPTQGFLIDNRAVRVRYLPSGETGGPGKEIAIESKEKIPDYRWAHIAFTYDAPSGVGALYINGRLAASHDGPAGRPLWWSSAAPDLIFLKGATGASYLDEVRVSSRALKPDELLVARGGTPPREVIGYWRMESAASIEPAAAAEGAAAGGAPESAPSLLPSHVYTVRLVFAELEGLGPGERIFDVALQGEVRLSALDIAAEAGGPNRTLIKEIEGVPVENHLKITLSPRSGKPPLLGGVQAIARSRSF